jgi:hypothetical protein
MAWKAPWQPEPDPLRRRARGLDDEEKEIADQLARLRGQLDAIKNPPPPAPKETVWRAPNADASGARPVPAARRDGRAERPGRVHSAQRRRDRTTFILLAVVFLILLAWVIRHI